MVFYRRIACMGLAYKDPRSKELTSRLKDSQINKGLDLFFNFVAWLNFNEFHCLMPTDTDRLFCEADYISIFQKFKQSIMIIKFD